MESTPLQILTIILPKSILRFFLLYMDFSHGHYSQEDAWIVASIQPRQQ